MTTYRVMNIFQGASGASEDVYVNTWHFIGEPDMPPADITGLAGHLFDFYLEVHGGLGKITDYMHAGALSAGHRIKIYDLDEPTPRVPRYDVIDGIPIAGNTTNDQLPEEIALCLSFKGTPTPGVSAGRRRGRVYLGPWAVNALNRSAANTLPTRPDAALSTLIVQASQTMATAVLTHGFTWAIYSPTNNASVPVAECWVDDAFDVQRRRGVAPASRISHIGSPFVEA